MRRARDEYARLYQGEGEARAVAWTIVFGSETFPGENCRGAWIAFKRLIYSPCWKYFCWEGGWRLVRTVFFLSDKCKLGDFDFYENKSVAFITGMTNRFHFSYFRENRVLIFVLPCKLYAEWSSNIVRRNDFAVLLTFRWANPSEYTMNFILIFNLEGMESRGGGTETRI